MKSAASAIGIDYDGTIADTNALKVAWIKENLGLEVPPWRTDRTLCVPIIGLEAYERMSRIVYSPEFSARAKEVPGAAQAIKALARHWRIYVVTARDNAQVDSSRAWLQEKGLLPYISGFLSSAERAPDGTRLSKAALCARYGLRVLIDDDERHLRDVLVPGLQRILLKSGCDEELEVAPGIELARSWPQAVEILNRGGG